MAEPIGRRRFLGASAVLATAVLVGGCREEPDATSAATTADGSPNAGDLDLVVAFGQIEQTLAGAFGTLVEVRAEDLETSGLADLAAEHGTRHRRHAQTITDLLEPNGVDPVAVASAFPGMAVPTERDLADLPVAGLLGILARCEAAAAATGADAVGRLTLPELRGPLAALGADDAGLAQSIQIAIGGGLAAVDQTDVVDGLLPLDRSYLAG